MVNSEALFLIPAADDVDDAIFAETHTCCYPEMNTNNEENHGFVRVRIDVVQTSEVLL